MQSGLPPKKVYKDDWGTAAREGYEDRGAFHPVRAHQPAPGSPILRTMGSICIVAGMCWGAYLLTQGGDIVAALQQNHGPVAMVGMGVIGSLLGKYLRI